MFLDILLVKKSLFFSIKKIKFHFWTKIFLTKLVTFGIICYFWMESRNEMICKKNLVSIHVEKKCPFKSFEDVSIYSYSPFEKYIYFPGGCTRTVTYLPQRQKSKILICFRLFLRDRSLLWAFIPTKKIILTFKTVNTVWLLPLKLHHFFGISASVSPIIFDQTISKPVRRSKKVFIVAKYVTSLRFSYLQNKNKTSEINGKSIVHTKLGNNENFHP